MTKDKPANSRKESTSFHYNNFPLKSYWVGALIFIFALIAVFSFRTILDIDIGFHLRGGQWILENLKFHDKDVFTYTVNQNEYIALHWLYQVIIYSVFKISGYSSLTILNLVFILAAYFILYKILSEMQVPLWLSALLLFASVFVNEFRFIFRPEIITWLFFLCYIFILNKYYFQKQQKLLFLLPVLQLLWVNSHGLFIIGLFVIFCYWFDKLLSEKKNDKTLLKYFLFSLGASLLNPYFINGLLFPFYLATRLNKSNVFKILIGELKSPFEFGFSNNPLFPVICAVIFYLFVALSVIAIIINLKKIKIHQYIIFAATLYIASSSIRNVPMFILYACMLIGFSLSLFLKERKIFIGKNISYALTSLIILFCIGVSLRVYTGFYYSSDKRGDEFGAGINPIARPMASSDFLNYNKIDGRIVNDMLTGSWLMWKIPQPVFIDGRLEVMQEKFAYEYGGSFYEGNLSKLLAKYKADVLVFNYSVLTDWTKQIIKSDEWRLVHADETAAIYLRKGYREDLQKIKFPDISFDTLRTADILNKNIESNFNHWLKGFYTKSNYPEVYSLTCLGYLAFMNGDLSISEKYYLAALDKTQNDYKAIYTFLSNVYDKLNDKQKKDICLEKIAQLSR